MAKTKLIPVQKFLEITCHLPHYKSTRCLLRDVFKFYGVDPTGRLDHNTLKKLYRKVKTEFAYEVGSGLATFLLNLISKQADGQQYLTAEKLIHRIVQIYTPLIKLYTPILVSFIDSVARESLRAGVSKVYLLARDALPLLPVALARQGRYRGQIQFFPLEVNRRLLGIVDEIADVLQQGKLEAWRRETRTEKEKRIVDKFLSQQFRGKLVACVDIGYYGTIPWILKGKYNIRPMPLFFMFASANPLIWGFLNRIFDYGKLLGSVIPYEFMWILGDTIEAMPKPYGPSAYVGQGRNVILSAPPSNWLFGTVSYLIYYLIYRCARMLSRRKLNPWTSVQAIFKFKRKFLDETQNPTFPILPSPIKEWSQNRDFMKSFYVGFGTVPVPPQPDLLSS